MRHAIVLVVFVLLLAGTALASNELIVTEIMYNSIEDTDVEWIEFYNDTSGPLDLTGWYVLDDNLTHTPMPLSGTMAAGAVMLLVGDETLFTAKYPGVTNYFPVFFQTYGSTWALGNGGDAVNVFNASDELVFSVTYDDAAPWPTEPDGDGPSLLLIDASCTNFSDGTCWTAGEMDGTPGVLTETVSTEDPSWGSIKILFR
jgi:hypothetical protein